MWTLAVLLLAAIATLPALVAFMRERRLPTPCCAQCHYDLSATPGLVCPECGHLHATAAARRPTIPRARKRRLWSVAAAAALAVTITNWPQPWTRPIPTFLLRGLVHLTSAVPTPPPAPVGVQTTWQHHVWSEGAGQAFEVWADAVLATRGPISDDELARLVPRAEATSKVWAAARGQFMEQARLFSAATSRVARRRAAARAAGADEWELTRYQWVLAEFQRELPTHPMRIDHALVPDAIILQAMAHADPAVRRFGVERFGNRMHAHIMDSSRPLPPGLDLFRKVVDTEPDPEVRAMAKRVEDYGIAFRALPPRDPP